MNTELQYWLEKLRHERWILHGGPDLKRPDWLAAHYAWQDCADVVIIHSETAAVAFRTPTDEKTDLLNPDFVTWVYSDDKSAVWVLRAVLSLPRPGYRTRTSSGWPRHPCAASRPKAARPSSCAHSDRPGRGRYPPTVDLCRVPGCSPRMAGAHPWPCPNTFH
jgi:hypothetical protein